MFEGRRKYYAMERGVYQSVITGETVILVFGISLMVTVM